MRRDHDGPATYSPPFGFSLDGGLKPVSRAGGRVERPGRQRLPDLVQRLRILDRRWDRPWIVIGDLLHRAAQDLAGAGFWQAGHDESHLEGGDRADLVTHQLNHFL